VKKRGPTPFPQRLLGWYDANRRDLPWRGTGDPWAIWVSEIMLQQTRVEAVREAWSRFVARFPTPADYAQAGDDEVLSAWRGLGYYRRARLLREGAREVVAKHAGRVPSEPEALGDLPGIGAYTRGAIASIAFARRELAIDGNVERVVARHRGVETEIGRREAAEAVRATVRDWQPAERPGDFNQALMELGALVCTPKAPRCEACPAAADCVALARGLVDRLPVLPARRPPVAIGSRCVLVRRRGGGVLATRVPSGAVNAGQVELPTPGVLRSIAGAAELAGALRELFEVEFAVGAEVATVRHTITHHRIVLTAHEATCTPRLPRSLVSARPDDPDVPWTTPARKVFAALRR
jgi:A/G-specific adenine glycosylase